MAIDATEGGSTANSYVTTVEADTYFTGRLNPDGYTTADTGVQERALRTATTFLDARIVWIGDIKDQTTPQALAWPRVYDSTLDTPEDILVLGQAIPQDLKNAQCEMALYLITSGEPDSSNDLDSIKVGSLSIDFNEFKSSQLVPDIVWSMISYLGNRITPKEQVKSVDVIRK
jgi:hypothetical protein